MSTGGSGGEQKIIYPALRRILDLPDPRGAARRWLNLLEAVCWYGPAHGSTILSAPITHYLLQPIPPYQETSMTKIDGELIYCL